MDKTLKWNVKEIKEIKDCRIFKIEMTSSLSPKGEMKNFFRINSPDWVTVIAILEKDQTKEFILVKQFRHGSQSLSLEFPAGMVDQGETPQEAAKRELLEETGYIADKWSLLGSTNPNPAFMTNTTYTFLAEGLKCIEKQQPDPDEFIEVTFKPENKVSSLIGKPPFDSAIMVQAYYFYQNASRI